MQLININRLLIKYKKSLTIGIGLVIFATSFIANTPTWILSSLVSHYSHGRLRLANTRGTFWHGNGILVANEAKFNYSTPIVMLDWHITLGIKKFVNVDFAMGSTQIAQVYVNATGANLDNLKLALSVGQLSQLLDVARDLELSGNILLSAEHISLGANNTGQFTALLSGIASGIAPVNPLGTYKVQLDLATKKIEVSTQGASVLELHGSGSSAGMSLNATIDASKKDKMIQFITLMGIPQADGSYMLKIF